MAFQNNHLRTTGEVALEAIFLFQVGVGTLANVILFFYNVFPVLRTGLRPIHVILPNLAVANSLVLLSAGIPHMMVNFVLRKPLSSLGCKVVCYVRLVARSTTLCSTCVLSTYQYLTLFLGRAQRAKLRGAASKALGPPCGTCWMLSAVMNIYVPVEITVSRDRLNDTDSRGSQLCWSLRPRVAMVFFRSVSDAMFIGLMSWASGSMVLLLQRHHQRLQHIHTTTKFNHCHKYAPEASASHTILMLVAAFVIFYMLNSTLAVYTSAFVDPRVWLMHASDVLVSCFPTVCPVLLISRDSRMRRFCSQIVGKYS
ncbi:vomeronasal type-1 receptor 3 [Tupaia chinensis]|uniref:Vomeronasal type-1 receptor n=1 Tax=Tupaia chinensis TaxID=246437 RepID=L8YAR5_TUPCH|nr:vomeronasal type-1 receptor 3 [Tupaia chinensis]ELV11451.1 Vomeronasal type-1 receptor 3 [Tupaia chinensis]